MWLFGVGAAVKRDCDHRNHPLHCEDHAETPAVSGLGRSVLEERPQQGDQRLKLISAAVVNVSPVGS